MNRLLILSPLALAACVQHQDPCFPIRPIPCNPLIEECLCDDIGQDRTGYRAVVIPTLPDPVVTPPNGGDSGESSPDVGDDDVSDETSDNNEDDPRDSNSEDTNSDVSEDTSDEEDTSSDSDDSNGDNSDD